MAIYTWAAYVGATGCTKYGPAGAQAVVVYLEDWFPEQASMGICNCREVFDGGSWSHHAECRAYDQGTAYKKAIAVGALELLGPHGARIGLDHMIVNHNPGASGRGDPRIYSARSPQGRTYTGAHPHKDHNHIGLTRAAGRNLTYATLVAVCGEPPNQGGSDMLVMNQKAGEEGVDLQHFLNSCGFRAPDGTKLKLDGVIGPNTFWAFNQGLALIGRSPNNERISSWNISHIAKAIGAKSGASVDVSKLATKTALATHEANPDAHHA